MSQTMLLTGGAGFIGSHIAVELLQDGYDVVIADDLSNSRADVIDRIEKITGRRPAFYRIDAADGAALSVVCLRYFNPVGAHESGLIGERPNGVPNNLMPYITQTAAGIRKELSIFGDDYETPDGTGVRDYIHITDLARGHIAAIGYTEEHVGWEAINLGTGHGTSVLKLVQTFERVNGVPVPHRIAPRRAGDLASCYAGTEKARRLLGWQAEKGLEDICRDAWRWQRACGEGV